MSQPILEASRVPGGCALREELEELLCPVHLLITEAFFLEKVAAAAHALERNPVVPDWEADVLEQVAGLSGAEVVIDLELDCLDVSAFLHKLRADSRTQEMAILGYCSHNLKELIEEAQGLGVQVVVRSSFAANLVRLMQELFRPASEVDSDSEG